MTIDVYFNLEDIGLFRQRRIGESSSQYERAKMVRDAFGECMDNALHRGVHCDMPRLCAINDHQLHCYHLRVDYMKFIAGGIPLPHDRRKKLDSRLRGTGTLVYRALIGHSAADLGTYAGDIHIPSLEKVRHFTGRKNGGKRAPAQKPPTPAQPAKPKGFLAWFRASS